MGKCKFCVSLCTALFTLGVLLRMVFLMSGISFCVFSNLCSKKEMHEECISLTKKAFLQTWFLFAVFSYCESTTSSIVAVQMVRLGF